MALIEVRLRPTGPWRVGHRAGDRERVDVVYHSDALYSAITHAMRSLGWMDEWLDATARAAEPAVRLSSLYPFIGKTRLIAPPRSLWPRPHPGKLYLEGAKLIPLEVAQGGALDESRWSVDGSCECMVPSGSGAPFQVSIRSAAAVDRLTGATEPHRIACLEFAPNAGWWGVFDVSDKAWEPRVKAAFRLLADSGFGGERSRGWGRASAPEFSSAGSLFPSARAQGNGNTSWWLLSLYSPHETDAVDWSHGDYSTATRGGWTDSPSGSGAKKSARMIEEGSVLSAASLRGRAVDVAPDGFAHPVYRAGFALAVPVPVPSEGGGGGRQRPAGPVTLAVEPVGPAEPEATEESPPELPVVAEPAVEPWQEVPEAPGPVIAQPEVLDEPQPEQPAVAEPEAEATAFMPELTPAIETAGASEPETSEEPQPELLVAAEPEAEPETPVSPEINVAAVAELEPPVASQQEPPAEPEPVPESTPSSVPDPEAPAAPESKKPGEVEG